MNIFEELNNKLKALLEEDYIEHEEIINENINKPIEYKGYKIYNTDKETVFVNKINDGYNVWTLGNIVKNPKEVIDNIDKYTNEGGSTFVQTEEELQNELKAFGITENLNEGEVISFAKAKALKDAEKAIADASDSVVRITIESVNTQNYAIDGTAVLESSVAYDFKYLQTLFYALDRLQEGENIPLKYRARMIVEENGEKERFVHEGYIAIGQGSEQANMLNELESYMDKLLNKTSVFEGDIVPSETDVQKKIIELRKHLNQEKENNAKADLAPAKDYSNGGKKFGPDAEVGDILYYSFNYGSTQHYFLKVIERKGASVKLASLEKSTDLINDDDGRVVPSNVVRPDNLVDGKTFRLHKSKGSWDEVVCKVDGRYCYYWDGKPKRETYMD